MKFQIEVGFLMNCLINLIWLTINFECVIKGGEI